MAGSDSPSGETSKWQQVQFRTFARRLHATAEAAGQMQGAYVLDLGIRPDLLPKLRAAEPQFLQYILSTSGYDAYQRLELEVSGGPPWWIEKYGSHRDLVEPMMSFGAQWQGETVEELKRLIRHRNEVKQESLPKSGPAILLLIDAYLFGDDEDWDLAKDVLQNTAFHTVARTHGRYECQILSSRIPEWVE